MVTFNQDYFRDDFTGSGSFSGRTPDSTAFGGQNWVGGALVISSGAAASADQTHTGSSGTSVYGIPNTAWGNETDGHLLFDFTTGPSTGADANGHAGFSISVNYDGYTMTASLTGDTAGIWTLSVIPNTGMAAVTSVVTIAPSTLYSVDIQAGAANPSINLNSGYASIATSAGLSGSGYDGINLSWFSLTVGATCLVDGLYANGMMFSGLVPSIIRLPSLTMAASGTGPPATAGNAALTLPALRLTGHGGTNGADLTLPSLQAYAVGGPSANAFEQSLPSLGLQAFGGGTATPALPRLTLAATGTGVTMGQGAVVLPAISMSAAGTTTKRGRLAATLPSLALVGYGGAVLSVTLGSLTIAASGRVGGVGSAQMVLPLLQLSASGTMQNHGGADLVLPAIVSGPYGRAQIILPMGRLTAIGHAVVSVTYEAYVMNLKPTNKARVHEVTRYTGMPFSGMVRWQGNWYGWGPSGMYLIGGDTDAGEPIAWAWKTGVTNFSSRQMKVVRETFLHGRLGPTATASVSVGEDADVTYAAVIERGRNAQAHRIKYGKGLKAEYWSFGLADVTGSAMEVDSMQHEPQPLSRKI